MVIRCAGATHTEAMVSTILSSTMDLATKTCRNTQKAAEENQADIHQPTMFSQTNQMYCSLPKIQKASNWTGSDNVPKYPESKQSSPTNYVP